MTFSFRKKLLRFVALGSMLCLTGFTAVAQLSATPYSSFGLGDLQPNYYGRSMAMGGASLGLRLASTVNYSNPASYSALGTQSFLFETGLVYQQASYENSKIAQVINSTDLAYINAAVTLIGGRWHMAGGIHPYTHLGYNIETSEYDNVLTGDITNTYLGTGGINSVYWGNSFTIVKGLSVGFNLSYLFGSLDNQFNSHIETEAYYSTLSKSDNLVVGDYVLDYGLQYYHAFSDDFIITLGATYGQKASLSTRRKVFMTQDRFIVGGSTLIDPETGVTAIDTLIDTDEKSQAVEIPQRFGLGASVVIKEKLVLAADYAVQQWADVSSDGLRGDYADTKSLNIGLEFTPNYRSLKYWSRVRYRAGIRMYDSYWKFDDNQIQDRSVSVGMGLPFKRSSSMIDISFELGQRGTTDDNLSKETYFKAGISLSLHDIWFIKRKFD